MDRAALLARMAELKWYHKIDVGGGVVTPGYEWDIFWNEILAEIKKVDYHGKRVLDTGTWDGRWAFEAERNGAAEVIGSDILSLRPVFGEGPETFQIAKQLLDSKATFRDASVYNCDEVFGKASFDVIQCFGIVYHLRYPEYAFAKLRRTLKDGGLLLMETAVLLDTDAAIIELDHRKIYAQDRSTWNAFSMPALRIALETSYFEILSERILIRQDEELKIGRGYFLARATRGVNDHHFFPYPELEEYFAPIGG